MKLDQSEYGVDDTSYKMAGALAGITALVDDFYQNMSEFKQSKKILEMHPKDLTISRQKLTYFLSGWLGGPKLYAEHFGSIRIPMAHKHLNIGNEESEVWLACMQAAVNSQPYQTSFKEYLMIQLRVPAERIVMACGNA